MGVFKRARLSPDLVEIEKIRGCAQYCLNTPEGKLLLSHLIEVFELDYQTGFLTGDEAIYTNGKQDGLKYILALLEEQKGEPLHE